MDTLYLRTEDIGKPDLLTLPVRISASRSIFVSVDVKVGELVCEDNLTAVRPRHAIHSKFYRCILGKEFVDPVKAGIPLSTSLYKQASVV